MRDELTRARERLVAQNSERPFYIQYRLLDLDGRTISAEFGALVNTITSRNRFMSVEVRVGDYKLDSSNFITDEAFRGFIGSTGQVGIDRDYESLRQDLWLATDQAYKEALVSLANKRGFLRSLAQPPNIDDFSREKPVVLVAPRLEPDWTARNWEEEAKAISAALRAYPQIYSTRVTYHLTYATSYLMNSEGTEIRVSRSLAAIEASLETQAGDGMPLHNFYAAYARRPAELPSADAARKEIERAAKEFQGQPLLGSYDVDEEGVRGERAVLVENGILRRLLMSRRPGPDFDHSNGHGRASFLGDARPAMSNLFFNSSEAQDPAELRKKFLDKCREEGRAACLLVRRMDNPALSVHRQEDLSDMIGSLAAGAASGDRLPLLVYRVYVADGREELVRGARLTGLNLRALRNLAGVGKDTAVFSFQQNQAAGFSGTALAAFGSAQNGLPSAVAAPSLLLDEVEVRGARGEPRRLPLLPPPPIS